MDKINFNPAALGLKLEQQADSSPQSNPSSDPPCPYGKCPGNGLIPGEKDGYEYFATCQCAKDASKLRYLGQRFMGVTLGEIVPRNASQADLMAILSKKPDTGIFLYGKGGAGKTHFLAAMYNFWEAKHKKIKYLEDAVLKDELRNAELNNDHRFVSDLVKDHDCVFLDDVGKAAMTPFHQSALYRFANEMYKQKKYLFITANDPLNVLGSDEYWGAHVARRIEDLCQLVQF